MLKKCAQSIHRALLLILEQSLQSLTIKYDFNCGFFTDTLYEVEGVFFCSLVVECFYHEKNVEFSQMLFLYQLK